MWFGFPELLSFWWFALVVAMWGGFGEVLCFCWRALVGFAVVCLFRCFVVVLLLYVGFVGASCCCTGLFLFDFALLMPFGV